MARYVWRNGRWHDRATGAPMAAPAGPIVAPQVMRDIPEYRSPIHGRPVTSRSERREDLKRSGCREVDPSEFTPQYRSRTWAERMGGEWNPNAGD